MTGFVPVISLTPILRINWNFKKSNLLYLSKNELIKEKNNPETTIVNWFSLKSNTGNKFYIIERYSCTWEVLFTSISVAFFKKGFFLLSCGYINNSEWFPFVEEFNVMTLYHVLTKLFRWSVHCVLLIRSFKSVATSTLFQPTLYPEHSGTFSTTPMARPAPSRPPSSLRNMWYWLTTTDVDLYAEVHINCAVFIIYQCCHDR